MASYSRIWFGLPPSAGAAWTSILNSFGAPSAPPTITSFRFGCRSMACMPPRRMPGVCVVKIADESLRGHVGHLDRHIAAGRQQRLAVGGEYGAANPVVVGRHVNDLLEGLGVEGPQGVIGRRPRRSACRRATNCRRTAYRSRSAAEPRSLWEATSHTWISPLRQGLPPTTSSFVAVAGESHRFDAFRHAHQPRDAGSNRRPSKESPRESRPRPAAFRPARNRAT